MKTIKQSAELLTESWELQGIYDSICEAAATCYKSEPKCGKDAEKFVEKLIANKHFAMLEFGTVYLDIPYNGAYTDSSIFKFYDKNPYSRVNVIFGKNENSGRLYITTNYRVIIEHGRKPELNWLVAPSAYHFKRIGFKLITSIGIARELTRHRVFSFAQESTRYCNYCNEKFSKEITFVLPYWYDNNNFTDMFTKQDFIDFCKFIENQYIAAVVAGAKPEEAREMLPLCTKTEICMCGFTEDWGHFFDLRRNGTTGRPHPDMLVLADLIYNIYYQK